MEMYPGIRKMFRSTTVFDPDDFLLIFKFLNTRLHLWKCKVLWQLGKDGA